MRSTFLPPSPSSFLKKFLDQKTHPLYTGRISSEREVKHDFTNRYSCCVWANTCHCWTMDHHLSPPRRGCMHICCGPSIPSCLRRDSQPVAGLSCDSRASVLEIRPCPARDCVRVVFVDSWNYFTLFFRLIYPLSQKEKKTSPRVRNCSRYLGPSVMLARLATLSPFRHCHALSSGGGEGSALFSYVHPSQEMRRDLLEPLFGWCKTSASALEMRGERSLLPLFQNGVGTFASRSRP